MCKQIILCCSMMGMMKGKDLVSVTFRGGMTAIDRWNLITFSQLLACGYHPVCELKHRAFEEARSIYTSLERNLLQMDLFRLLLNFLPTIFRHKLVLPVVHHKLLYYYRSGTTQ